MAESVAPELEVAEQEMPRYDLPEWLGLAALGNPMRLDFCHYDVEPLGLKENTHHPIGRSSLDKAHLLLVRHGPMVGRSVMSIETDHEMALRQLRKSHELGIPLKEVTANPESLEDIEINLGAIFSFLDAAQYHEDIPDWIIDLSKNIINQGVIQWIIFVLVKNNAAVIIDRRVRIPNPAEAAHILNIMIEEITQQEKLRVISDRQQTPPNEKERRIDEIRMYMRERFRESLINFQSLLSESREGKVDFTPQLIEEVFGVKPGKTASDLFEASFEDYMKDLMDQIAEIFSPIRQRSTRRAQRVAPHRYLAKRGRGARRLARQVETVDARKEGLRELLAKMTGREGKISDAQARILIAEIKEDPIGKLILREDISPEDLEQMRKEEMEHAEKIDEEELVNPHLLSRLIGLPAYCLVSPSEALRAINSAHALINPLQALAEQGLLVRRSPCTLRIINPFEVESPRLGAVLFGKLLGIYNVDLLPGYTELASEIENKMKLLREELLKAAYILPKPFMHTSLLVTHKETLERFCAQLGIHFLMRFIHNHIVELKVQDVSLEYSDGRKVLALITSYIDEQGKVVKQTEYRYAVTYKGPGKAFNEP